jgi:5-methylcytosine-specific restriction endonuclease McrA
MKPRKLTMAQAMRLADKAFAEYIRARDPQCVTCGKPTSDCSHVFSRAHHATRWNEFNAFGQCRACHFKHHNQSESWLLDYARRRMGQKQYENMRELWDGVSSFKTYQVEEIARFYSQKAKRLREGT